MCSSDQEKKNPIHFFFPFWGEEERSSDHQSYNPSKRWLFLSLSVDACPSSPGVNSIRFPHRRSPQEAPVSTLLVCASCVSLCLRGFLPLQGRLIPKTPGKSANSGFVRDHMFLICSPLGARLLQPRTDQVAMSQRGPVRLERHLPCFFSVCEYTCPPTHTTPSSYLLWLCSYGVLNTVPYLTRYLLMLTKCRVSVSQVVVQGTRPSSPSPISHLLVSAAISRGTCSLVHLSTQAWNLWCSRLLTRSWDCKIEQRRNHPWTRTKKPFKYKIQFSSKVAEERCGLKLQIIKPPEKCQPKV